MEKTHMQVMAEVARFDAGGDYRKEKAAAAFDPATMTRTVPVRSSAGSRASTGVVPGAAGAGAGAGAAGAGAFDTDLDWAGQAPLPNRRRLAPESKRESLGPGLEPVEGSEIPTFAAGSRKHYEHDTRFRSIDQAATNAPLNSATYQLGPGGKHTASDWVSTSHKPFVPDSDTPLATGRADGGRKRGFGAAPAHVSPDEARAKFEAGRYAAGESASLAALAGMTGPIPTAGGGAAAASSTGGYAGIGPGHTSGLGSAPTDARTLGPGGSTPGARYVGGLNRAGGGSLLSGMGAKIAGTIEMPASMDPERAHRARLASREGTDNVGTKNLGTRGISGYQGYRPMNSTVSRAQEHSEVMPEGLRSQYQVRENFSSHPPGYTGYKPADPRVPR